MSAEAAAKLLRAHAEAGTTLATLPDALRPTDRAAGYRVQACYERFSDAPLFGWKIAATSVAGQAHIGVDGPLAGRLLAERVHDGGAALPLAANRMRVAEPEFAFRLGRALSPRERDYEPDEVLAAVASLHPAIEVPDSRFSDFTVVGAAQLIADNACADRFVLGPATMADWRSSDLARHGVRATVADDGGAARERTGAGANVLGGPMLALAWLANELSTLGITLEAGQVVTTGTCMVPLEIAPGDLVTADFGVFGRVAVRFTP